MCWIVLSAKETVKEEKKARKCWAAVRRGLAKKVTFKNTLRGRAFQAEETGRRYEGFSGENVLQHSNIQRRIPRLVGSKGGRERRW